MEFYPAERKKKILPFATAWMELESIMLSEISQSETNEQNTLTNKIETDS